jgi:hypothetical protein
MQTSESTYADFKEACIQANQVTQDLYKSAKKFVETVEPEINQCVKNISVYKSGPPYSYEAVFSYMSHFDDFALSANKLFTEAKKVLEQSENCMQRISSVKNGTGETAGGSAEEDYLLSSEISELFKQLKILPLRTQDLEKEMKKLENNWKRTREKTRL